MKQNLLTKHCALLLLLALATAWSTPAWADVTINVKAPSAPHMYVWNSSQTKLNGEWPGAIVTDTKVVNGESYYTKTFLNEDNVSVIFAKDNDTQTGDFTGLTGEVFFHYNGEKLAFGDLPDNAIYEPSGNFVYFVNSKNWSTVNCHVYNGNSTSTEAMTFIGNDKAGQKVYKWGPNNNLSFNPANVIFNNGNWADQGGAQTPSQSYTNGGYYVYSETNNGSNHYLDLVATIDASRITNTATYFADEHFREGITKSLGVAEGAAFTPADYTILDLSYDSGSMTGKISNLSGIEHFTNLEELDISNNSIPYGDITALTKLKKIVAIGNPELQGFGVNPPSASNKILRITTSSVLEYVDVSNTAAYYLTALNNNCGSTLKTLIAANNPTFDYGTFKDCSALEYLDFSNCGLTRDALSKAHFEGTGGANLKYIDVSNNSNLYNLYVSDKTGLETIIMKNCTAYDYGSFDHCPNLKHADFSGCTALASDMWNHLKPEVHTHLQYLNLSNGTTNVNGHTFSFPALDTLIINNHGATLTQLDINTHCPSIIDITNNTHLANVTITNCGLTTMPNVTDLSTATALTKIDLTGNAFTAVPTVGGYVTTMVLNNNQLVDIVAPSNINYLYAQNNNFGNGDYTLPTTSLVGLDLGNNGFTKFKAENNTSLKSLALAGNTNLTEIELHGNTALTQTSPDGIIESDNGLYIKGLSNLQTLNIENSSFNKLGQQNSLEGVTGLTKLQARHNEFTTFTNGVYALDVAGTGNYRKPDNTESSLEHLTALEYLDLAYNNLQDSVHLYKNVALKHLDVSHNNEIHGVIDGTIDPNDAAAVEAMKVKKGYNLMKYGRVYGKDPNNPNAKPMPGWNPSDAEWTAGYTNLHALRDRPFDLRECDLNDTTGLYHLDLGKNVNLEWLDISYTNIHNTAAGPSFMNPGWMDKDWVTDMGTFAGKPSQNTTTHRAYMSWHTFVYIIPCSKLKTLHMDHNNMQSMGVRYFPELDTLTSSYMYGDCALMRDFNKREPVTSYEELRYGYGNTGLSGSVVRYTGDENLTTNSEGIVTNLEGSYPNPTKYVDVSHSGFNSFHVFNGVNLEYLDVSYNPLNYNVPWNDLTKSYNNSLDVTYCPNIKSVIADNSSDLPIVRAHNRAVLETLDLTNDPKLKTVYIQNDPQLNFADAKDDPEATAIGLSGLSSLTGLETLFGYNNTQWGGIDVVNNTALKNLWISNIGTSSINVANNANLEKLRAYDNSLTALDLSNNGELLWLDVARNKLPEIDLRGNSKLQFFNISNGSDTRIQLDGTEDLNHDGSDGDAIKPTTIFSADEAPIANADAGNSLSDLALPASITDARANGNDLHSITGNFANLTNIEFAHNHINGIDLSAAPGATIESRDNGRTIVADCAFFAVTQNHQVIQYKVYFFQLDATVEGNGTVLTLKDSEDLKGDTRRLGTDGMVMDNITWDGTSGSALKNTITPGDMSALDPDYVPGKIVVLNPTSESGNGAEGTATYTYQTGENSTSEFYLNWSSDGTVTGINEIKAEDGVSITNTYGNLTINGKDGTAVGVYDLNGRQVASETIVDGSVTINGLTPGIYVVNGVKVLLK